MPQDVQRCLSDAAAAERYERLTLQRCIEVGDGFGACPGAGCPYLFAWEEDNRKLECPLCHNSFCLVCRTSPWHRGKRCEEFQAERGDEGASDALFKRFTATQRLRQCPKCRFWVEKTDGCDAMHCRCNLVFCYKCGGCLKAKEGIKKCDCAGVAQLLRAHEGAHNHNNPGAAPAGPGPAAALHGMMQGVAAAIGLPGMADAWPFGGGAPRRRGGGGRRRR